MSRLMVVEDDQPTAELLRLLLTRAGHEVAVVGDGRSALRRAYQWNPELVILDIGLPELDGWQVLKRLRDLTDVPVLVLSGHDRDGEKVRGLREGADDYLTKPVPNAELVARVEALLRRSGVSRGSQVFRDGALQLDPVSHQVYVHEREVALTRTEFRLLHTLVRHPGATLTLPQLLSHAWDDPSGIATSRVKFAVLRLRRKLGWDDPKTSPLQAVRGVGYRYRPPSAGDARGPER